MTRYLARHAARLAILLAIGGTGLIAAEPAYAFFGSFEDSCRDIRVYGGGQYMEAWCRRLDGSWRFARIYNCGGAGVRNDDGFLRCGT